MKAINISRLLIAMGIIGGFLWLHWWVMPSLGMFRVLQNASPIPHTGTSLIIFLDGKVKSAHALSGVTLGWPIVWTAWPFALICILGGIGLGYSIGEFSRRKFVIEILPEKTRQELNALSIAAYCREYSAKCMLRSARTLYVDANRIKDEVLRERKKLLIMGQSVEEQLENGEELRHKAGSLEKELAKAIAKIRQLQKKVDRQSGEFG